MMSENNESLNEDIISELEDKLAHYDEKKWTYSFSAWPDDTWKLDKAMFQLFDILNCRVELHFTESQFERFRSGLSHHGLTLREIERVPYFEPERITE